MAAADPQVRIEMLERALHWAQLTIQKKDAEIHLLQERLRKQRIGFLGPSSETLCDLQLELLTEEEPGATREEVEAESRREPMATARPRERKPHPGRKPLPEHLPRVEEVIACEANCTHCGGETRVIGYDWSEVRAGPGTGQVVRAGHQARKTFLRKMFRDPDATACATHRGKRTGQ
jgi:hypothetical protein